MCKSIGFPKKAGEKMKKHNDDLFRIGEAAKILGVTRRMILNFEDHGLLTPAVKDENSGYRYYTADNMTQIHSIRSLQALGLSLKEISDYYYDDRRYKDINKSLERLMELRDTLDQNIQMLQVRSASPGDLTVRLVSLPRLVCFCKQYQCTDVAEASNRLRETYIAAARTGLMSLNGRMFTVRQQSETGLNLLCCIPVKESFDGPERREFPQTPALCIYYRGPYEGTGNVLRVLMQYIRENNFQSAGYPRSIYLEGPPNRGEDSANYITQIAVPIIDKRDL